MNSHPLQSAWRLERSWKGHLAHSFDARPNGHKLGQLGKRRVGVRGLDDPRQPVSAEHAGTERAPTSQRAAEAFPGRDRDRTLLGEVTVM